MANTVDSYFAEAANNEDWYPCYDGNQILVKYVEFEELGYVRVMVLGMDDYGMFYELPWNEDNAKKIYNIYTHLPHIISKNYLTELDFQEWC